MAKLILLLLLVICVHASLVLGAHHHHGEKPMESHVDRQDHHEEAPDMMSMMVKMLRPLRDLFVKVLDLGHKVTVQGRPSFCGKRECPEYQVLNKTENYELRKYNSSQWVSTSMQGKYMKKMTKYCFERLFKYIEGYNELEEKIEMTVPVTNLIKRVPGSETIKATMSFYISPSVVNPPHPNNDEVWIQKNKGFKVYVHSFGGHAKEKDWTKHAKMLQVMLDRDGLDGTYYTPDVKFITAGYDAPWKLFNRHNEVWLLAKDKEA